MSELLKDSAMNIRPPFIFNFSVIVYVVIALMIVFTLVNANILMITHIKKMRKAKKEEKKD